MLATDTSGTAARVFNAMKSDLDAVLALREAERDGSDARITHLLEEFVRTYR